MEATLIQPEIDLQVLFRDAHNPESQVRKDLEWYCKRAASRLGKVIRVLKDPYLTEKNVYAVVGVPAINSHESWKVYYNRSQKRWKRVG